MPTETVSQLEIDRSVGDFSYPEQHEFDAGVGLSHDTVDYIANVKGEEDKVASGLAALHHEDPTFLYAVDAELRPQIEEASSAQAHLPLA